MLKEIIAFADIMTITPGLLAKLKGKNSQIIIVMGVRSKGTGTY